MKHPEERLHAQLKTLKLRFIQEHYTSLVEEAAREQWSPLELLTRLIEGESECRSDRALLHRLKAARFPVLKTLDVFDWSWPRKINRPLVQDLFRLAWIPEHGNVILLGGVGLGKTHLATALAHAACLAGYTTLFTSAIEVIQTLDAAQRAHRFKTEIKKYLKPQVLVLDEIGYLPIDHDGANLLFQVIRGRYERGALILTTNQPPKHWAKVFNNDSTLASALLDRLLHHAHMVVIDGPSYRLKDRVEDPAG
jgi:DNA replication protein DnaC